MSLISFSPLQDGVTSVNAAATNTPLSTIYNDYNGNITDANISASAAINASKVALPSTGAATATVATSQAQTNTSYSDLATAGPAVTVMIGANGLAQVSLFCGVNQTTSGLNYMGFAVSGATTTNPSDTKAIEGAATTFTQNSAVFLVTGLTPGSTTFTAKYRVSANTGTYVNRTISVIPL